MARVALTQKIKGWADDLGFSAIGIAPVSSIPEERIRDWLSRGYQGRMAYLERNVEKRLDPNLVLPGARSLICVALNYFHPYSLPYEQPDKGVISRYAAGGDYHRVMGELLRQLESRVKEDIPAASMRSYVDTGPILEKYWAVRAGVGWIGKHTNLISKRRKGSWFFLGEILTDLELEYDQAATDHCGRCRLCIDACPTEAIVAPFLLDSRRCISYLTIELREDIPEEHRSNMKNLIFGCDICQDVCPWNRKAGASESEEFKPVPDRTAPSLEALAELDEEKFEALFQGSPIRRTKWRGLLRNVAVAMGNSGDLKLAPALGRLLENPEAIVRRHAAWGLQRLMGGAADPILEESIRREKDEETARELKRLLGSRGTEEFN